MSAHTDFHQFGSIDTAACIRDAQRARGIFLRELVREHAPAMPEVSATTKRRASLFTAALGLAAGAFWAIMLITPPQSSASQVGGSGVPVFEMMSSAPFDLGSLEADAI